MFQLSLIYASLLFKSMGEYKKKYFLLQGKMWKEKDLFYLLFVRNPILLFFYFFYQKKNENFPPSSLKFYGGGKGTEK